MPYSGGNGQSVCMFEDKEDKGTLLIAHDSVVTINSALLAALPAHEPERLLSCLFGKPSENTHPYLDQLGKHTACSE